MINKVIFVAFILLETFSFSQVVVAGDAVARVYGETIYRDQLESGTGGSTDRSQHRLSQLILGPLYERYVREHGIAATDTDVQQLLSAFAKFQPQGKGHLEGALGRQIAEPWILKWKLSKALYEQYRGTVIFQQGNPLEPVGAMRRFLEEQEQSGAFEIFDEDYRRRFWEYYTRQHSGQVPPEKVDFDQPWWLMRQQ
ncbi:MAG: hypothetical protein ACREV4_02265 [Gammaproteobacteria bacterium]